MNPEPHHVVMLAAENDIIPGGKVGGIGDVIRDIPVALAACGQIIDVVIPAYGSFHKLPGSINAASVSVTFGSKAETCDVYELYHGKTPRVRYWVIDHPLFGAGGEGTIYCDDGADKPFASDANKFALFSLASCEAILNGIFGSPDTIHCHDWHTGFVSILIEYDSRYQSLQKLRTVFSIHNLALQGIRPLQGDESSLNVWYPKLGLDHAAIRDPRWPSCVNPMVAGINLSDAVHTVSPSYAEEIRQPNAVKEKGFHGGEGLEQQINAVADSGRLFGILNGCQYDVTIPAPLPVSWTDITRTLENEIASWQAMAPTLRSADYLADKTLSRWIGKPEPAHLVTSVGRLTDQKVRLLTYTDSEGRNALEHILESLQDRGVFILLGTGDVHHEALFTQIAARYQNFLFLNRYAQSVADLLYRNGSLFLMPSSFEPCGISQMLAMRESQPCLVHAVGGLKDTVIDQSTGFVFSGSTVAEQGKALVTEFNRAINCREQEPDRWQTICDNAGKARFPWETSARLYIEQLYDSTETYSASTRVGVGSAQ